MENVKYVIDGEQENKTVKLRLVRQNGDGDVILQATPSNGDPINLLILKDGYIQVGGLRGRSESRAASVGLKFEEDSDYFATKKYQSLSPFFPGLF